MKNFILFFLTFLLIPFSNAQFTCNGIGADASAFQQIDIGDANFVNGGLIKLYFHIYNNSSGSGGIPLSDIDQIVANLNANYQGTDFSFFYNPCETQVINNTSLHNSQDRCDFFFQGAPSDGINIHVKGYGVNSPLVASGIPGNEILIGGTGLGVQFVMSGVMAHEMGHCLGLFHTFQGHCTSISNPCNGPSTNNPLDPNGDFVNDTAPDKNTGINNINPSNCSWNGNGGGNCDQSINTTNAENFMAYTQPTCMSIFTPGQIARIKSLVDPNVVHASGNADLLAEYSIVDANGNEIDLACPGDQVFLNACDSEGESSYSISILEYELDGYANGESSVGYSQTDPVWIDGEAGCMINLNDIWDNFMNYDFRSGYEYNIQLRVLDACTNQVDYKIDGLFTVEYPTPDYVYVDENGTPTNTFCQGDIVYLDGSGTIGEDHYFLSIWKYNIGGHAAGEDNLGYSRLDPSWAQGEVGSMINLNEIWNNFEAPEFEAGYEYLVQLAVNGPCDSGWNVKEDELFYVEFPTPDYTFVDAQGNEKDVFCLGETVYLDGSGSEFENRYFLSIWKYNIGGFENGESGLGYSRLEPSWAQGEVGSLINLNEIWANFEGDYFEPGFEYRVQLAVTGECDNGWNVKEDEVFTVICCDGPSICDADFIVNTTEDEEGNISFDFINSDEVFFDHTWYVYQHDEQGEGPYTLVEQSSSPLFSFRGEIGGCYTIIHEVETPCGTCCYSREICNEETGGKLSRSSNETDCNIICLLDTPTNLSCFRGKNNYLNITWDEVDGADGYILELIFNDPECCGEKSDSGEPYIIETETNSIELQFYPECMSYTVTAICDGVKGEQSEKKCFNYKTGCGKDLPEEEQEDISLRTIGNKTLAISPNPTSSLVQFKMNLEEGQKIRKVELLNVQGEVIENVSFNNIDQHSIQGKIEMYDYNSGMYILRIELEDSVITKKIIRI